MIVDSEWKLVGEVFGLSGRELELAQAMISDATRSEASTLLGISPATARTYTERLYRKMNVHSKAALVAKVLSAVHQIKLENVSTVQ